MWEPPIVWVELVVLADTVMLRVIVEAPVVRMLTGELPAVVVPICRLAVPVPRASLLPSSKVPERQMIEELKVLAPLSATVPEKPAAELMTVTPAPFWTTPVIFMLPAPLNIRVAPPELTVPCTTTAVVLVKVKVVLIKRMPLVKVSAVPPVFQVWVEVRMSRAGAMVEVPSPVMVSPAEPCSARTLEEDEVAML